MSRDIKIIEAKGNEGIKQDSPLYETDGAPYGKVVKMNGTLVPDGILAVVTPESTERRSPDRSKLWTVAAAYEFATAIQSRDKAAV